MKYFQYVVKASHLIEDSENETLKEERKENHYFEQRVVEICGDLISIDEKFQRQKSISKNSRGK